MRVLFYISSFLLLSSNLIGQFSYFNIVSGNSGDQISEGVTNLEILYDTMYVWGGGIDSDNQFKFIRTYSELGQMTGQNTLEFNEEYIYNGGTNSFLRIPGEDAFLFSHGSVDSEGTKGFLMKVDADLDTLWTRRLDIFPPHTYIYTHAWDGDGFVLTGEFGVAPGEKGTFLAKVDTEGELLWHHIIHQPWEGIFRNVELSILDNGYLVSGSDGNGFETEGVIEILNSQGDDIHTLYGENTEIFGGTMRHLVLGDGMIIVSQSIIYEDYPPISDPSWGYTKLRLYELNSDASEPILIPLAEYFTDYEWIGGGIFKMIEVNDKIVMVGNYSEDEGDPFFQESFAAQIDRFTLEMDWYTPLTYDPCVTCTNQLYDIEQAPDGGYVMVGKFDDAATDPYDKTWLVKVDACGDLEWQGCEPVGIDEWEVQSRFNIYPNPVSDELHVELSTTEEWDEIRITDFLGQEVKRERSFNSSLMVDGLKSGLYILTLYSKGLPIHSQKFMKE